DFASLSGTMDELLGDLALGHMQFSLSAASRSASEDELIKRPIAAFRQRADIATESRDGRAERIVPRNLHTHFLTPRPYTPTGRMMAMAADMEMATPAVEGGEADVQVSADGVIEVQMR